MLGARALTVFTTAVATVGFGAVVAPPATGAAAPLFLITPTAFDFGDQPLNSPSPTETVTVKNVSGSAQLMNGTGGGAGVFGGAQNCQGLTIAAGASCQMFYTFTPTTLGRRAVTAHGAWNGQSYTLHFTGVGTPEFQISPTGLDFGAVAIGASSTQQMINVTNLGTTSAMMNGTGGAAASFGGSQNCQGLPLAAGASCQQFYTFTPTRLGVTDTFAGGKWNGQAYFLGFRGLGTGPATDDFIPLSQKRILDTRNGTGAPRGTVAPGHVTAVTVGNGVPANAVAADLTVTATNAAGPGSLTVWPCGAKRPGIPTLTFRETAPIANHVNAALGTGAKVCLEASRRTHLIANLDGYYPSTASYHPAASMKALTPTAAAASRHRKPGRRLFKFAVGGGPAGVQPDTTAVALNLTATHEAAAGHLIAWPCTGSPATPVTLSYRKATPAAALAVSGVGAGETVCVRSSARATVSAVVEGWYASQASFTPVIPQRVLDTHRHIGYHGARPAANATVPVKVTGVGAAQIPANARAVVVNVTASRETGAGRVALYPCGATAPALGVVSFTKNQTVTDVGITPLGTGAAVCLRPSRSSDLAVDVVGWYGA